MTVVNTKLYAVNASSGATQNTTFVNCNFYNLYSDNFSGTIINSIIDHNYYTSVTINSTVVLNSLYNSGHIRIGTSSVFQNCYSGASITSNCECTYDTLTLQSKGYLGTDGTVVGIYGGDTPYTLEPSVPKVTSSDLKLDMEQKKLNVTLTVSPQ